jgi:Lhr-like helicase
MAKVHIYVTIPDAVKSFIEEATGVGKLVKTTDQHFVVEMEDEDLFELGGAVAEFQNSVNAFGDFSMKVDEVKRLG